MFEVPLTLRVSLLGLLVGCAMAILCFIGTASLSSLGSITRPKPRAKVVICVYVLLVVSALELAWLVFSTYSAAVSSHLGEEDVVLITGGMGMGVASGMGQDIAPTGHWNNGASCSVSLHFSVSVGLAWFAFLTILLMFLLRLDPCGCFLPARYIQHITKMHEQEDGYDEILQRTLSDYDKKDDVEGVYSNQVDCPLWMSRFRQIFCFCCRRNGINASKRSAFGDVVKVLQILFSDVDSTFSDILAGFLLTRLYQKKLKAAQKNREHELTKVSAAVCLMCVA